ncbi:hypothetical protein J4E86_005167 [Alternaria arbusti]|uniref:uncharacterized protein n=1 Tax=Alternaria arbusti TaxID=232088 RepID=UPI00221FB0DF|nr:uncharacterized protein J4E86_005167 [Alternaria arbusti]KAI4958027.1 hypothetical protein J4E86_005167 [Alternaria arbusti]
MSDYIDDFDFSSLSIDDIDLGFVPQDDLAAFESLKADCIRASSMPYEHFDNTFAAPMPVSQPPLNTDAMMHEHPLHGITPWSFATPGNQRSHRASMPSDTVFA